jgi:hypothetical protein
MGYYIGFNSFTDVEELLDGTTPAGMHLMVDTPSTCRYLTPIL